MKKSLVGANDKLLTIVVQELIKNLVTGSFSGAYRMCCTRIQRLLPERLPNRLLYIIIAEMPSGPGKQPTVHLSSSSLKNIQSSCTI